MCVGIDKRKISVGCLPPKSKKQKTLNKVTRHVPLNFSRDGAEDLHERVGHGCLEHARSRSTSVIPIEFVGHRSGGAVFVFVCEFLEREK
jgi:hypothetical protein